MATTKHWRILDERRHYSNRPLHDNRPSPKVHNACGAALTDQDGTFHEFMSCVKKPWPGMPTLCPECVRLAQQAIR